MRLGGKTVCLFFLSLFILISPLYAQSFSDEGSPFADGLLFFEELFISEGFFYFDGYFSGEDELLSEEPTLEPQPNLTEWSGEGSRSEPQPDIAGQTIASEGSPSEPQPDIASQTIATGDSPSEPQPDTASQMIATEGSRSEPQPDTASQMIVAGDSPSEPQPDTASQMIASEDSPDEEFSSDDGTLLSEGSPPEDDDDFIDEDAFFFEAPPLIFEVPVFEMRSLDVIFPNFSRSQRRLAMSDIGLRNYFEKDEAPTLIPAPDLGIDLIGGVMKKNPSHLIETLVVVPYNKKEFDLLDVYNALGRIEKIKDYPASLNGDDFYVFTESTRIESARSRKAVSDPSPAVTLPFSETMYLRLKEINFGNLFIRGDISISMYGITYSITNFTDVRYFLVPIVKAEKFITKIYIEPVKEGILIYSMCGFYIPGFIADKVNLNPNINRRIQIFINWITEGLRKQESAAEEQENISTKETAR